MNNLLSPDSKEIENYVNNVKEQIMNTTQDNLDYG